MNCTWNLFCTFLRGVLFRFLSSLPSRLVLSFPDDSLWLCANVTKVIRLHAVTSPTHLHVWGKVGKGFYVFSSRCAHARENLGCYSYCVWNSNLLKMCPNSVGCVDTLLMMYWFTLCIVTLNNRYWFATWRSKEFEWSLNTLIGEFIRSWLQNELCTTLSFHMYAASANEKA